MKGETLLWLFDQPHWVRHAVLGAMLSPLGAIVLALVVRQTDSESLLVPVLVASIGASPVLGWLLYRFLRWSDEWEGVIDTRWVVAAVAMCTVFLFTRNDWIYIGMAALGFALGVASLVAAVFAAVADARDRDSSMDR